MEEMNEIMNDVEDSSSDASHAEASRSAAQQRAHHAFCTICRLIRDDDEPLPKIIDALKGMKKKKEKHTAINPSRHPGQSVTYRPSTLRPTMAVWAWSTSFYGTACTRMG